MFYSKLIILCLSLCLVSCAAGSGYVEAELEYHGGLDIEPSQAYDSDYKVKIRNHRSFTYNMRNRQERIEVLNSYVSNQCPSGYDIKHEEVIKKGEYLLSNDPIRDYFIYIKCK